MIIRFRAGEGEILNNPFHFLRIGDHISITDLDARPKAKE